MMFVSLKNNKATAIDSNGELIICMHQLLSRIWSDENMPDVSNLSVLCKIHKKENPTICAYYHGTSLLNIA